ncbi:MAG: AAA family ATPase [Candidatus Nitronauta litoralis]|uniref:AAA family ATPase n=1 Tax=Candidatus Nitronauta litoralis TaxID=2705533 RepID=A0A7T0BVQ2_9BACT|nr:MAG: AAA family ATPase [Candidatus Nitronauta litoralis]
MQLREIHIDSFGATRELKLTGLAPGINVLYGPNEYGKSTVMEFVRRVLFGYKVSTKHNAYQAEGKNYGGRLAVETSDGKNAVIARTKGPHGGPVTITLGNESLEGEPALKQLLGHASKDLFNNVYAFTLDELQDLDSLGADEVKNRIYGAGMGLNRVSLSKVMEGLGKEKEDLFKKQGSIPKINSLYKEYEGLSKDIRGLSENLPAYDRCVEERNTLETQCIELEEKLAADEKLKRDLELRLELYPVYLDLDEAHRELETLGPRISFRENTREHHEKLVEELAGISRQISEEKGRLNQLQTQLGSLKVPQAFLEKSHDVEWMRQKIEQVKSAKEDLITCQHDQDRAEDQIQADIKTFDPDWDEERVKQFTLTGSDLSEAEAFAQSLQALEQRARDATSRLDYHRQQKAAAESGKSKIPGWLNSFVYGFAAVAAGLLIGAAVVGSIGLALGGVLVAALAGLLLFNIKKRSDDFETEDLTEANLEMECRQATEARDIEHERWRDWAGAKGLSRQLAPHKIELTWGRIREIKGRISDRENLGRRIAEMQKVLDEAQDKVEGIAPHIDDFQAGPDLIANLSLICKSWDQARGREEESRQLMSRIEEQTGRIARLEEQSAVSLEAKATLVKEAGVENDDAFKERLELFSRQTALENKQQDARRRIQERVGGGGDYKLFVESLGRTKPNELEAELERIAQRLEENRAESRRLRESMGKLEGEAERLVSEETLLEKQTQQESLRAEINRHAREWAKRALAEALLKKAKDRYEKTRQPGVIVAAAKRFERITEGRYQNIIKRFEEDNLVIQDKDLRETGVVEMSRGTREQLYLSLRLGLIEEYESRAEPLPIIMDDVFVNFDDDRKPRVLELLKEFTAKRQVLLMTCHRDTRDLCLAHGAKAVEW